MRRTRVAAVCAALLGSLCLLIRPGFHAAARLPGDAVPASLELASLPNLPPIANPQPGDLPIDAVPRPAVPPPAVDSQPVSRPLAETVRLSFARREYEWKPHGGSVSTLATTSDGRFIVSAGADRSLAAWDVNRRQLAFVRTNLAEPILALTTLTNLAIVTALDATHQLHWWSLDGAVPLKSSALDPDSLFPPVISRDGHVIACSGPDRRSVSLQFDGDWRGARLVPGLSSWAKLVRFAPSRQSMAVVCHDDSITLYRLDGGAPIHRLRFPEAAITDVAYSTDGERLAALGAHGGLRVWNPITGAQLGERVLPFPRAQLTWLSRGRDELLIAGENGRLLLLDCANALGLRDEIQAGQPVTALIELGDGSGFLTGHASGAVGLWRLDAGDGVGVRQFAKP